VKEARSAFGTSPKYDYQNSGGHKALACRIWGRTGGGASLRELQSAAGEELRRRRTLSSSPSVASGIPSAEGATVGSGRLKVNYDGQKPSANYFHENRMKGGTFVYSLSTSYP
jgi:hypothetical protein